MSSNILRTIFKALNSLTDSNQDTMFIHSIKEEIASGGKNNPHLPELTTEQQLFINYLITDSTICLGDFSTKSQRIIGLMMEDTQFFANDIILMCWILLSNFDDVSYWKISKRYIQVALSVDAKQMVPIDHPELKLNILRYKVSTECCLDKLREARQTQREVRNLQQYYSYFIDTLDDRTDLILRMDREQIGSKHLLSG